MDLQWTGLAVHHYACGSALWCVDDARPGTAGASPGEGHGTIRRQRLHTASEGRQARRNWAVGAAIQYDGGATGRKHSAATGAYGAERAYGGARSHRAGAPHGSIYPEELVAQRGAGASGMEDRDILSPGAGGRRRLLRFPYV